ncbi:MAG: hypothetical protein ACR2OD_11485, partial [Gaiellaceae bacterium]
MSTRSVTPLGLAMFIALVSTAWLALAGSANAASARDVATELDLRGYYVEGGGSDDTVNTLERVSGELGDDAQALYLVSLSETPSGGADLFARDVQGLVADAGTVYVATPDEVGADSVDLDDAELGAALDASLDSARSCFEAGGNAFAEATGHELSTRVVCPAGASSGERKSSKWPLFFLIAVPAAIGGAIWWSRRRQRHRDDDAIEEGQAELRAQLNVVAANIVEHADRIQLSQNAEAIDHFRDANEIFASADARIPEADDLLELAEISDQIDLARWHFEAADALVGGRELPPKPQPDAPAACFFDPTHRPGTEPATLNTKAGSKEVRVCGQCAGQLRTGKRPSTRNIDVERLPTPAGKAPRSHGGGGMGGLDAFEIILGGLGSVLGGGIDFDWGSN